MSPQMLLNCNGGGNCSGGDVAATYSHLRRQGITDETCQPFQAEALTCTQAHVCMNCARGGGDDATVWPGICTGVQQPILWYVSEYGAVRGAFNMKAEILLRGPIGCGIEATPRFQHYSGGIFSEKHKQITLDHQVSVLGWGIVGHGEEVPEGTSTWIGRNFWGSYWGELGWFRCAAGSCNGIEQDCDWAVPSDAAPTPEETDEIDEKWTIPEHEVGDPHDLVELEPVTTSAATILAVLIGVFACAMASARASSQACAPAASDGYIRVDA